MALFFMIGYMGCGKSTSAKKMARTLGYTFIDLDAFIEKNQQQTVSALFASKGEAAFRAIEHQALQQLLQLENTIIACGGGTPCFYDNMQLMNSKGITIYIQMEAEALVSRLINARQKRPLIANKTESELLAFVTEQLKIRSTFYEQAQYVVRGLNLRINKLMSIAEKYTSING